MKKPKPFVYTYTACRHVYKKIPKTKVTNGRRLPNCFAGSEYCKICGTFKNLIK